MRHKNSTHGLSKNRIYRIWRGMKLRCDVKSNTSYPLYGAKGIKYDPRWKDFMAFVEDVGLPPTPNHSLDRINPDFGYWKSNVKWSDYYEQARNRKNAKLFLWKGKKITVTEIGRIEKKCPFSIRWHMKKKNLDLNSAIKIAKERP